MDIRIQLNSSTMASEMASTDYQNQKKSGHNSIVKMESFFSAGGKFTTPDNWGIGILADDFKCDSLPFQDDAFIIKQYLFVETGKKIKQGDHYCNPQVIINEIDGEWEMKFEFYKPDRKFTIPILKRELDNLIKFHLKAGVRFYDVYNRTIN